VTAQFAGKLKCRDRSTKTWTKKSALFLQCPFDTGF